VHDPAIDSLWVLQLVVLIPQFVEFVAGPDSLGSLGTCGTDLARSVGNVDDGDKPEISPEINSSQLENLD